MSQNSLKVGNFNFSPLFLERLMRFCVVGTIVTMTHVVTASAAVYVIGISEEWSNVVAYSIAALLSFMLNVSWSFSSELNLKNFCRFCLISAIMLCITYILSVIALWFNFYGLMNVLVIACLLPLISFTLMCLAFGRDQNS